MLGVQKGDVGQIIEQMADKASEQTWVRHDEWVDSLRRDHDQWMEELYELASASNPIHPMLISESLQRSIGDDTHITYDGGDYCHFLRASIKRDKPFRFHNVSSFGMIGVGLPYGIGAQVALPGKQVVLSVGDGSFGFNGMEIDTMGRHNLPAKMILGNNSIWGIDWQIQKGLYGRPVWTVPTRYGQVAAGAWRSR